jgi:hypothetical protein
MPGNPKVIEMVRRHIAADYATPTASLQAAAAKIDPSVKRLPTRSFFATYVLAARRAANAQKTSRSASRRKAAQGKKNAEDFTLNPMPDSVSVASVPVHVRPAPRTTVNGAQSEVVIRHMMTEIARDAMRAESRPDFLDLLARIDRYSTELGALIAGVTPTERRV